MCAVFDEEYACSSAADRIDSSTIIGLVCVNQAPIKAINQLRHKRIHTPNTVKYKMRTVCTL